MNKTDYQTPKCMVLMLEFEGEILTSSSATWGGALNDGLNYDIWNDEDLN